MLYIFFWVFPRRQIEFDAGEIPRRKYTIFKSRRKSETKLVCSLLKSLILKFVKNVKSNCGDAAA